MRQIREPQLQFGHVPIEDLRFVGDSRDDIPAILRGLQQLYCTRSVYWPVMALLEKQLLAKVNARTGRPGLDLWQILVLGILKQGLRIDFDRLCELANQHRTLRHMLVHGLYDETHYRLQRLVDNVALLTPSLLQDIDELLVRCGHAALLEDPDGEPVRSLAYFRNLLEELRKHPFPLAYGEHLERHLAHCEQCWRDRPELAPGSAGSDLAPARPGKGSPRPASAADSPDRETGG